MLSYNDIETNQKIYQKLFSVAYYDKNKSWFFWYN